ncbi:MAG: 50S ribosomal protein L9 [Anaerolineae bacterium]|nr:50S ribosomal protein L9 [Anaerolineae bacterium]
MKVILLQDIYKHGVAGEVVTVADGFARNWLIPQKLAVQATPGALKQAQNLRARAAERRSALDARLNELAHQIDGVELYFGRRASPTGKLFGSVTTTEIAQELREKTRSGHQPSPHQPDDAARNRHTRSARAPGYGDCAKYQSDNHPRRAVCRLYGEAGSGRNSRN